MMKEETSLILKELAKVNDGLAEIKEDVAVLKRDVSGLKEDVAVLKQDVSGLKEDVAVLKQDVSGLKEDVAVLKQDVSGLKEDVSALRLDMEEQKHISAGLDRRTLRMEVMMENEFRTNLSIVAEGHLDLSRKLSEALRVNQEKELFLVRFNRLESDVKDLKEFTGMI